MPQVEPSPPAPATGSEGSGDFLQHLNRGGELLMAGKNPEALAELERAFHLEPKNAKVQNLLGLAYFKLGQLDRAEEIYELLVHDNPADPTLRINLGLVHLKAEAHDRAIRQLETAADLSSDRQKPLNYLGLAYAQAGRHAQALDAFRKAGNQAMVEKMERALAAAGAPTGPASPVAAEISVDVAVEVEAPAPVPAPAVAAAPVPAATPTAATAPAPAAAPTAAAAPAPTPAAVPAASAPAALATGLGGLLQKLAGDTGGAEPFQVTPEGARLRVRGELRARLGGLCWLRGEIRRTPEQRRFRGLATDKAFGEGPDRLHALAGQGELFVAAAGLHALEVDEPIYLREDGLFAFEATLSYENGRISSPVPPDLLLVHLSGKGRALLRAGGELRSLQLRAAEPLELPMDRLVGWTGSLMPSVIQESAAEPRARWLRLEGEGWVLWTAPPK